MMHSEAVRVVAETITAQLAEAWVRAHHAEPAWGLGAEIWAAVIDEMPQFPAGQAAALDALGGAWDV